MKVWRMGVEFELTKDELYAAHFEWEYSLAYDTLYARIEVLYPDWPCSLRGPSIKEIVEEAVATFLDSLECDCARDWAYDNAIAEVTAHYGVDWIALNTQRSHENTIS